MRKTLVDDCRNRFFHFSPEDALTLMGPRMEKRFDLNWMFLYQLVPYLVGDLEELFVPDIVH